MAAVLSFERMDREVHEAIVLLHHDLCRVQRQLLAEIAEHDRVEGWRAFGTLSEEAYLAAQMEVRPGTAKAWVRCAHALDHRPELGEALESGMLSMDKLIGLVDVAALDDPDIVKPIGPFDDPFGPDPDPDPDPDPAGGSPDDSGDDGSSGGSLGDDSSGGSSGGDGGLFGAGSDGEDLLGLADQMSAQQLAAEAARRRKAAEDANNCNHRRRHVRVRRMPDGRLPITGDLWDDQAAAVWAAFNEYAGRAPKDPATGIWEPLEVRYADALAEMANVYLAARGQATGRPALIIHADRSVLDGGDGWAETADGTPLAAETARRIACWSELILSIDDEGGNPLALGRTLRLPSWQLAEAVRRRDGGCRFPGCDRTLFIHPHHIREWDRDHGPTDFDNLAGLCTRHHHHCHEGGWKISGDPNATLTFTSPDRTVVLTSDPAGRRRRRRR